MSPRSQDGHGVERLCSGPMAVPPPHPPHPPHTVRLRLIRALRGVDGPPLLRVHLLLTLLSAPLLLWRLGEVPFLHGDESLYVASAFDSFKSGRFWIPTLDGDAFFVKAPLSVWLFASAHALVGPGILAGRLISVLAALATVLVVAQLAGRLFRSRLAALVAGLVLVLNPAYLYTHCARWAEPDSVAILFFALTALAYDVASERRSARWLLLAGVCAGLCAMAKSLLVGVLPLAAIGLVDLLPGRRFLGWIRWSGAVVGMLAIVVPWHLSAWSLYGEGFVESYLFDQTLSRMDAAPGESRWTPAQVLTVFHALLPFTLLGMWVVGRPEAGPRGEGARPGMLALTWLLIMALAISAVSSRLPWWVLPAYPALALLTAAGVIHTLRRGGWWLTILGGTCLISSLGWRIDPAFDPHAYSAVRAADDLTLVPWAPIWSLPILLVLAVLVTRFTSACTRGPLLLAPAVVVMALEAMGPLTREVQPSPVGSLTAELDAGGHLNANALYLGPVLPSGAERTHLELAYAGAGGDFRIADDTRLLEEARGEGIDHLIVPSSFLARLRADLGSDWSPLAMVRTACAQYGAQSDWMVVLARSTEPLQSVSTDRLFEALTSGTDAERVEAAEGLAATAPPGAVNDLIQCAADAQGAARVSTLQALAYLSGPHWKSEERRGLRDLLQAVPAKRVESMLILAALARCGDSPSLERLRTAAGRRPRVASREPSILRLVFADDFCGALGALADDEGSLPPLSGIQLWRALGAARVWAGIDELFAHEDPATRALAIDLVAPIDGRVVRTPPPLKKWLRARLQELAQSAGDQAVRDEALALARKNSPGIWVAWVAPGTSKNPSARPLD